MISWMAVYGRQSSPLTTALNGIMWFVKTRENTEMFDLTFVIPTKSRSLIDAKGLPQEQRRRWPSTKFFLVVFIASERSPD